jgi:hypothetical protein
MVSSGGGGSSRDPNYATPSGTISQYGQSSSFSPSYNNVLSNGMGWADVSEVDAANNANANANAAAQQQAASTSGSTGMTEAQMRAMLAQIMNPANTAQQQAAMRIGMMPGAQGSYAGNSRGAYGGGGGSSSPSRGGYGSSRS